MEKTENQIFEEFSAQLCEWARSGTTPAAGNQDIRYGLAQQKERLAKHRVSMEYSLKKRGEWLDRLSNVVFSDAKYTNKFVWGSFRKTVTYYRNGKKALSVRDEEKLFTMVTWLNQGEVRETYCCPNCGVISEIRVLMEGCPSCGTRFIMSDLFPVVTNYYFLRDYAKNNKESKRMASKWLVIGLVIGLLFTAPSAISGFVRSGKEGYGFAGRFLSALISCVLAGGVGAFFGYAAGALGLFMKALRDGIKQLPLVKEQMAGKKKLNDFMKQYDPAFSYEYFIGTMQSLIKILIYTDDYTNLTVYVGKPDSNAFDDIVDAQFCGVLGLNHCYVEGDYGYLDLNIYMTDVYCRNNRLSRKSDVFQMKVCRNIRRPADYGFSIQKVGCRSCGASFDASKEKHCPYCGTAYDLREDNWVVTAIRKK